LKAQEPSTNPLEPPRSCKGCARLPTCQIFRVIEEYRKKEWEEKKIKPPFPTDKLAKICDYFLPLSAVRTITTEPDDMRSDGT
jgi:hypothetical protein